MKLLAKLWVAYAGWYVKRNPGINVRVDPEGWPTAHRIWCPRKLQPYVFAEMRAK